MQRMRCSACRLTRKQPTVEGPAVRFHLFRSRAFASGRFFGFRADRNPHIDCGLLRCDESRRANAPLLHRPRVAPFDLVFGDGAASGTQVLSCTVTISARPLTELVRPPKGLTLCLAMNLNAAWTWNMWHRRPPSIGISDCLPLDRRNTKPAPASLSSLAWAGGVLRGLEHELDLGEAQLNAKSK
jgi:hypothetical protein